VPTSVRSDRKMFNRRGHHRVPSPAKRADDYMEPLDTVYPMLSDSFFPEYSDPHPGFENPEAQYHERGNETGEFVKSTKYAGTPSTVALSPQYSYYAAGGGDKHTPLSLQADETMSSDDDSPTVQHPSQFPWLSPPPRKNPVMIPVLQTPSATTKDDLKENNSNENKDKNDEGEKKPTSVNKRRIGIAVVLLVSLVIAGIVLAFHMKKPSGKKNSDTSGDFSLQGIYYNGSSVATTKPAVPTLMGTFPDKNSSTPNGLGTPRPTLTIQPSQAPQPTVAPVVATNSPSQAPSTRPPTLKTNHPLLGRLQGVVPREQLLDPNTPQGEALIWMATVDALNSTSQMRILQRYAMTVLDVALHAPMPRLWSSRNLHECNWTGVICNEERHITRINWARQDLVGTIPAELSLLTQLESLDIAQNQLKGKLEPLFALEKLKHAFVFENNLTGTLSRNISNLQNLTKFFAGHNQLSGSLPSNLKMRPLGERNLSKKVSLFRPFNKVDAWLIYFAFCIDSFFLQNGLSCTTIA
jgi:hypothetical protein